jgi:hypothetical protein
LVPADYSLFWRIKSDLADVSITHETFKTELERVLRSIGENEFTAAFQRWLHCHEKCIALQVGSVEKSKKIKFLLSLTVFVLLDHSHLLLNTPRNSSLSGSLSGRENDCELKFSVDIKLGEGVILQQSGKYPGKESYRVEDTLVRRVKRVKDTLVSRVKRVEDTLLRRVKRVEDALVRRVKRVEDTLVRRVKKSGRYAGKESNRVEDTLVRRVTEWKIPW